MLSGGKDSQNWKSGQTLNTFFFDIEENIQYWAWYWVAKTGEFENHTRYRLWYLVQCRVQYIVLTSNAYDRTRSCCVHSHLQKSQQWFGWWTPNWWGWTPWFCWSRAFTIPYTLIVPDIVYNIILCQHTTWASSTPVCTRAAVATFLWPTLRQNWSGLGAWTMSCDSTTSSENEFGSLLSINWTHCSETK